MTVDTALLQREVKSLGLQDNPDCSGTFPPEVGGENPCFPALIYVCIHPVGLDRGKVHRITRLSLSLPFEPSATWATIDPRPWHDWAPFVGVYMISSSHATVEFQERRFQTDYIRDAWQVFTESPVAALVILPQSCTVNERCNLDSHILKHAEEAC